LIRQRCCTRIANRFHFDLHRPSARPPDNAVARRMVPARPMPPPVRKVDRILIDGRNTRRRHHGIRSFKYASRHVAESSLSRSCASRWDQIWPLPLIHNCHSRRREEQASDRAGRVSFDRADDPGIFFLLK
jgi:hypothetical protein